jgi:hypothetical protein
MSDYPSLSKQLNNLRQSFHHNITYLTNRAYREKVSIMVSEEDFEKRMSICKKCDRYDESQSRCMECGCFMLLKARLGTESCPLYKWNEITN